ncbi:copper-binding transcription factor [Microbotryomycetes sp. JL201]|nr:copper-binding transcription factor [Microbotryomycetes sp. JL201]
MVLIDGVKLPAGQFACQSCIKGHRSSKCTHTSRTLVEIKKKGRPASQCAHCRDLRRTRSVHGRCDCAARDLEEKPKARVLMNGIVDIVQPPSPADEQSAATGRRVTHLLNPCNCRRGGPCNCCHILDRSKGKAPAGRPAPGTPSTSDAPSPAGSCCSSKIHTPGSILSSATSPTSYFDSVPSPLPLPPHLIGFTTSSTSQFMHSAVTTPSPLNPAVQQLQQPLQQSPPNLANACPSGIVGGSCCGNRTPLPVSQGPAASQQPQMSLLSLGQEDLFAGYSAEAAKQPVISSVYGPPPQYQQQQAPLFLPQTHGTSACFCGDLCACPGCPQHDPLGRKFGLSGSGQGCRCDSGREQMGAPKSCCGGGKGPASVAEPVTTLPGGVPADNMMQLLMQSHQNSAPILWGNSLGGDVMLQPGLVTLGVSTGLPSLDLIWSGIDPHKAMNMANILEQLPQHPFQQASLAGPSRSRSQKRHSSVASRAPSRTSTAPATPVHESMLGFAYESTCGDGDQLEPGCGDMCTCSADCACRSGGIAIDIDPEPSAEMSASVNLTRSFADDIMAMSLSTSHPADIGVSLPDLSLAGLQLDQPIVPSPMDFADNAPSNAVGSLTPLDPSFADALFTTVDPFNFQKTSTVMTSAVPATSLQPPAMFSPLSSPPDFDSLHRMCSTGSPFETVQSPIDFTSIDFSAIPSPNA